MEPTFQSANMLTHWQAGQYSQMQLDFQEYATQITFGIAYTFERDVLFVLVFGND
jgi:hypothetical protein